jgi:hypothetical protein
VKKNAEVEKLKTELRANRLLMTEVLNRLRIKRSSRKGKDELDYTEAAVLLGKCRRQIKRYVDSGKLQVINRGWRSKFFNKNTLLTFKTKMAER